MNDTLTSIATAVEPLRAAAISRAAEYASNVIKTVSERLAECAYALSVAYPRPSSKLGRAEYFKQKQDLTTASHLVTWRQCSYRVSEPCYADVDPIKVKKYIEDAKRSASASYDLFIAKLESKIGAHTSATLSGSHVWGHSELTVAIPDGSTQVWRTQMIVNVSKNGLLFNQFPSRQVKK